MEDLFINFREKDQDELKMGCLSALGVDNSQIRKNAAMCVAAIAQIEFPRGRWLDVIDKLAANVNNEDKCFRLASIECLGFICEEVSLEEVKRDSKDLIFSAIVNTIE